MPKAVYLTTQPPNNSRTESIPAEHPAPQPGGGGSTPTSVLFRRVDYWVRDVPQSTAEHLVKMHHYARGGSNTGVYRHGLFRRDDLETCLGVAWWIPPTPACGAKWWPEDRQAVLALTRLVIAPEVPKNAASYLLMTSVRLIQKASSRWRCLVTQADTWRGHSGHIYKIAGWEECGLGTPEGVWVDPVTGRMVSRKAGPKTRTRDEMLSLGYEFKGRFAKYRFRLVLPVKGTTYAQTRDVAAVGEARSDVAGL